MDNRRRLRSRREHEAKKAIDRAQTKATREAAEAAAAVGSIVEGASGPLPEGVEMIKVAPVPQELLDALEATKPVSQRQKQQQLKREREGEGEGEGGGEGGSGEGPMYTKEEVDQMKMASRFAVPAPKLMRRILMEMSEKRGVDEEVELEDLELHLGFPILKNPSLMELIENNPRLEYKEVSQIIKYRSKTGVKTPKELLSWIRNSPVPVWKSDFDDAPADIRKGIRKLVKRGRLIQIPGNKQKATGPTLYYFGQSYDIDPEFRDMFHDIHIPDQASLERELSTKGISSMTYKASAKPPPPSAAGRPTKRRKTAPTSTEDLKHLPNDDQPTCR